MKKNYMNKKKNNFRNLLKKLDLVYDIDSEEEKDMV